MIAFYIICSVAILLLLLNEFYFHVCLRNQQEHRILKSKTGKYDRISFGSSYGLYGLSFPLGGNGCNFCIGGQFFHYTNLMLREYAPKCLQPGGTVYLVIADLVFAEVGKGLYHPERYPLILSKKSLGVEYSALNYAKMRFPLFFNPRAVLSIARALLKGVENSYDTLEYNSLSYDKTLEQAKKRCASWCRQFRLKDTQLDEIIPELEETFSKTRNILTGMIQFCLDNGYNPVLVVTPVSKAMNECLSDAFINKVLYDNIRLANVQNILFLDYLRDERFQDVSLYHNNADFLNARGRKLFTEVLINDTIIMKK